MARMYSGKKGKAGSKKPYGKKASWLTYKPKETELLVVKLAKEGKTPSQIGLMLRDSYGIPEIKQVVKKNITTVLKENKLLPEVPEDIMALVKKSIEIKKHMEANKKDMKAKRGLQLTDSKIRRLVKYYKRTGKLAQDWKYEPEKAKLLVE